MKKLEQEELLKEQLSNIFESIEEVWYANHRLEAAKTLPTQAQAILTLMTKVSELASWHPKYDYETGNLDIFED